MKYKINTMISKEDIAAKVKELATQITNDYNNSDEIILIALLRGSVVFLADLAREIEIDDVKLDFMVVSSYGNSMESSRDVKIKKDIEDSIADKNVIIVEDIIDTGFTLSRVKDILTLREPKSLKICTLLDKPDRREAKVDVDYIGFTIPDEFVVGYGIDYAEKHRNLPFIGRVTMLD